MTAPQRPGLVLALVGALAGVVTGCNRQVCACAVHVGGTTPASGEEQGQRHRAVDACLERHGGGTIAGCPMPPSMPPSREDDVAAHGTADSGENESE